MVSFSDEYLIERLREGDPRALGILYERYKNPVYAYCHRLLNDQQAAEDAVHDTFLKIRYAIHTLQQVQSFRSWLFRVARNEAYTFLRRTRNFDGLDEQDVWEAQTPLEQFVEEETTQIVQLLMNVLRPEYREVLILREYEGLSYAEIAEVTGATESSVRSRLFKARKALTMKLMPYFKERKAL